MPAGKRQPANTMMYAMIFFLVCFLFALIAAIALYVRSDRLNQDLVSLRDQNRELATNNEWLNRGQLIGDKQRTDTYLGKMISYLDEITYLILGGAPEQRSAEAKVAEVTNKYQTTLNELTSQNYVQITDPNMTGLLWAIERLQNNLSNAKQSALELKNSLNELQNQYDDTVAASIEKEQILLAEKAEFRQQVEQIKKNYDELKSLMQQSTDEQVQILMSKLEDLQTQNENLSQQLMKVKAEFQLVQDRLANTQEQLEDIQPPPDKSVAAYKPDGEILLIDDQSKIVHINLGTEDRVYQGLTFSVYDKYAPIPKDGKGKAQIEVYNTGDTISAARIIQDDIKNPIILNDVIINLIWDEDQTNVFAVAGDFDLDGDTYPDIDGPEKIKALINKWGGDVMDNIGVETDYVVLGQEPVVPRKPTFEEMGVDPLAQDRYDAAIQRRERFLQIQQQAQNYSIPIFNTERFLYFVGYKSLADKPGSF